MGNPPVYDVGPGNPVFQGVDAALDFGDHPPADYPGSDQIRYFRHPYAGDQGGRIVQFGQDQGRRSGESACRPPEPPQSCWQHGRHLFVGHAILPDADRGYHRNVTSLHQRFQNTGIIQVTSLHSPSSAPFICTAWIRAPSFPDRPMALPPHLLIPAMICLLILPTRTISQLPSLPDR